jgi:hypothetical protein
MDRRIREIRAKIDAQMPVVSKIRSVRFHEGGSFALERDDGVAESQGFIDVQSPIEISANLEFKETVQNLKEETEKLALDFASQIEKLFFDRFSEITESVGNAIDMKGAPFTAESYLDGLDRVQLDFDAFGLPIYPTEICHPVMTETIRTEFARFRTEARLRERADTIIGQKRREWRDREGRRRLVT